jgi:TetR/AcrR family transcriptional regulator, cholesterol catabolism regulator
MPSMARPLSAPRPRVARGGQRRREELLAVACRIFAKKGFDGASLQDIADEFGVLKGSLFHYIQSKDDLLYEIIESVYAGAQTAVWANAVQDGPAVERLRRVIIAYVDYISHHLDEVTVWLHDFKALPEPQRESIRRYEERDRRQLLELIDRAQREGGIRSDVDPSLASLALLGSMNWVHRWFRPRGLTAREIGDAFAGIYLAGLAPR